MTEIVEGSDGGFLVDAANSLLIDEALESSEELTSTVAHYAEDPPVPDYLRDTYSWSYLNPRNVNWLDREPIVKAILWGQHNKLRSAAFSEIRPGSSVLQVAAVYGQFSKDLARLIGSEGKLKLIDVAPIQVENTRKKLSDFSAAEVCLADASTLNDGLYDVVLCYFLLHEIPDDYKILVMDNLLKHVKPTGKLVIVDYHKPHWMHPIKPITSIVFDVLEPFAKTLWRETLRDQATHPDSYDWQHTTYFGGLYQRVVVTHKTTHHSVRSQRASLANAGRAQVDGLSLAT